MFDLRDLYQQVIVDHNKSPRNYGTIEDADATAEGFNPLCGDRLTVYVKTGEDGDTIEDVRFEGSGCAISVASASLMTEALKGKNLTEFRDMFDTFQHMVTANVDEMPDEAELGKLSVLAGVREFPSRIKCATLCWHTTKSALQGDETAKTE